jgi:hypothetical protein
MREIQAFETDDGQIFYSRDQAILHEIRIEIRNEYLQNQMCHEVYAVPFVDLEEWLRENEDLAMRIINNINRRRDVERK